jgi:hypothetical protein
VHGMMQTVLGMAMLSLTLAAAAQKPIAYPSKGQSEKQQSRDEGECYSWAKKSTGVDPAEVAANPPPQSDSSVGGGERVRGATRGALGGAAIGAIGGDTGKGAGVGAVLGTMAGGRQARQNRDDRNQQARGASQEAMNSFNRGYGACMSGRGYTVSQ